MSMPEIRTQHLAKIDLPVQFSRLRDIAYNLWWTWSPNAQALFEMIDQEHWLHYRSPIEVLIDIEPERWHELQNDREFIRAYRAIVEEFDSYMVPRQPTWFEGRFPDARGPVAYFSTEYGWHESLQSYSGGLGILSGDHSKSASDLGLPFVGVGLMYQRGYFRQTVDAQGRQQHFYPDYDVARLPLLPVLDPAGNPLRIVLTLDSRQVLVGVWKATVGRVPVLLLDCDLEGNHPADRAITSVLYVSGREMRLCQEIVLGIGGALALKALGIRPRVWHINEGHSALLSLQRVTDLVERDSLSVDDALERITRDAVFTTHTPVPAGNEQFDTALIRRYFGSWCDRVGITTDRLLELGRAGDDDGQFNLTALAVRTTGHVNGVSELHGQVAARMWEHLLAYEDSQRIGFITNGVHLPTWIGPETGELLRHHLGRDFADHLADPGFAEAVHALPDDELWDAHRAQKQRLIDLARERAREQFARHGRSPGELYDVDGLLDPDSLLVGFGRRFATYKRADLLLRDRDRIRAIMCDGERPVQFVFAGKAHPADGDGQQLIERIFQASLSDDLRGRIVFLENYDMRIGRGLVQGSDVWLNNPRRPMEASGTSGMKAALNGALNLSVLDGWWCEGFDAAHGWVIGDGQETDDIDKQDQQDATALYEALVNEIVPCFYERNDCGIPLAWAGRMKIAIALLSPRFSTDRMVREYTERYYFPGVPEGAPVV